MIASLVTCWHFSNEIIEMCGHPVAIELITSEVTFTIPSRHNVLNFGHLLPISINVSVET